MDPSSNVITRRVEPAIKGTGAMIALQRFSWSRDRMEVPEVWSV